jgi:hypothetical protein
MIAFLSVQRPTGDNCAPNGSAPEIENEQYEGGNDPAAVLPHPVTPLDEWKTASLDTALDHQSASHRLVVIRP